MLDKRPETCAADAGHARFKRLQEGFCEPFRRVFSDPLCPGKIPVLPSLCGARWPRYRLETQTVDRNTYLANILETEAICIAESALAARQLYKELVTRLDQECGGGP